MCFLHPFSVLMLGWCASMFVHISIYYIISAAVELHDTCCVASSETGLSHPKLLSSGCMNQTVSVQ